MTEGAPGSGEFRLQVSAGAEHIDEQGHVSNVEYVRWIQDVAMAHSIAVGWAHEDYERLGSLFVVRKHEVEYLRPALEGDVIELVTHVAWWRAASSERRTRILRTSDGVELARASTLWAFVSRRTGRPTRIPHEVSSAFLLGGDATSPR